MAVKNAVLKTKIDDAIVDLFVKTDTNNVVLEDGTTTLTTGLNSKVEKVDGKGLSTNDYTTAEKTKLSGIATGANNYTHPSYTAKTSGLYKVTIDATGHVSAVAAVSSSDLTSFGLTATAAELNYTDGVTSNIQTQLNAKAPLASPTLTGTPAAPTASAGTNTTQIATTAFVTTAINNVLSASNAMVFKGTIGTGGTITALPASHQVGDVYVVKTAGTYAGVVCEVGDLVLCVTTGTADSNSDWTVVQTNINGAVTGPSSAVASRVAIFNGTTGKIIADSGYTIASSVPADAKFTDTTYSAMTGATTSAAGSAGLVPAPAAGAATRYLRSDGTWQVPPDTNTVATLSSLGLTATAAELNTLDGITATVTELNYTDGVTSNIQTQLNAKASSSHTHSYAASSSAGGSATSAVKLDSSAGSGTQPIYFSDGKPVATTYTLAKSVPSNAVFTDTTYSAATTSANGLMSSSDKTKLDGVATGAQVNVLESIKVNGTAQTISSKSVNISTPVNYIQASEPTNLKAGDLFFQITD